MLIQKTENYDQFKGVIGNRKIFKPHVQEIVSSIEKKNLLQFHPINVTKDMRIIDGQHRLEAAKALSLPIFYIIMDKDRSELFAGYLNELKKYCTDGAWKDREFLVALGKVMEKVQVKQLFYKLETFPLAITRRTTARDYVRQFEDIYNFKQRAGSYLRLS